MSLTVNTFFVATITVIAKGPNGEFLLHLYHCLDKKHITQLKFDELYQENIISVNKIMSIINSLQTPNSKGNPPELKNLPPNIKHQTSNFEPILLKNSKT